jgi:hypothetical protein
MSEEHVTAVFGPPWIRDARQRAEQDLRKTEVIILALRRKLIAFDATLPNEYDGTAWQAIEEPWYPYSTSQPLSRFEA